MTKIRLIILIWVQLFVFVSLAYAQKGAPRFRVCHGYDCYYRTTVLLSHGDQEKIAQYFVQLGKSPQGEREAIKKAVAVFESRSTQVIGVKDEPKMAFGRAYRKGQMDCVDESTNTDAFLHYLSAQKLLKYHTNWRRDSRGMFIDGRYPHWTAVIVDKHNVKWAVDSWYEAGGGSPDIMPLKQWKKRGKNGER